MTGELREYSREILDNVETQRLVSRIFSLGQFPATGAGVPVGLGYRSGIWYVLLGRKTTSAVVADYLFYTYSLERSASERPSVLSLADQINREFESSARPVKIMSLDNSGDAGDAGFPSLMIDTRTGEMMTGTNFNLGDGLSGLIEASGGTPASFPHPFHPDLDPFVKSLFLTRGLRLKPPLGKRFILDNLVEDAYQHTVGVRRETVKKEFQDMMKVLVGSRVFHVKGNYVTYLTDFTEYRRRFQRRYIPYEEKISRRTIFDYDPLSDQ